MSLPLDSLASASPRLRPLPGLAALAALSVALSAAAAPVDFGCGNCPINGVRFWDKDDISVNSFGVGATSAGSWQQSGGSVLLSDSLTLGYGSNVPGAVSLSGGWFSSQRAIVGYQGEGILQVSGGLFASTQMFIGNAASGAVALSGGRIVVAGDTRIGGILAAGSLTQVGGDQTVGGRLQVWSTGHLTLNGGTLTALGGTEIVGTTRLMGGTLTSEVKHYAGTLTLGNVLLAGALVSDGGNANIDVTGSARVSGGAQLKSGMLQIAPGATLAVGDTGFEALAGSLVQLDGGSLGGDGNSVIRGQLRGHGAIVDSGNFENAGTVVQTGALRLANTGTSLNSGSWTVGAGNRLQIDGSGERFANAGTLNLNGGSITGGSDIRNQAGGQINGAGRIAGAIDNLGVISVASGTLTLTDPLSNGAAGRVTVGGGTSSPATLALLKGTSSSAGSILLTNGTLDLSGQVWQNTGTVLGQGMVLARRFENTGVLQLHPGQTTVQADFTNSGTVALFASRGALTITGRTELRDGSRFTGFPGSTVDFLGRVSMDPGASFSEVLTLKFHDALDLAGNAAMTLDASAGTLSFLQGSTLRLTLGGTADSACDQLRARSFLFGGTLDVNLVGGFAPTAGASFTLFRSGNAASVASTGGFTSLDFTSAALANGLAWDTNSLYTTGTLRVINAVPEPGAAALWLGGLIGLGAAGFHRRARPAAGPAATLSSPTA